MYGGAPPPLSDDGVDDEMDEEEDLCPSTSGIASVHSAKHNFFTISSYYSFFHCC